MHCRVGSRRPTSTSPWLATRRYESKLPSKASHRDRYANQKVFVAFRLTHPTQTIAISKLISQEWKALSAEQRKPWDALALVDKERYMTEKKALKKQAGAYERDPTCPKRPMSAYLAFANSRKRDLKKENPGATNAELSKMLSMLWNDASDEFRRPFREKEECKRSIFNKEIAEWRKTHPPKPKSRASRSSAKRKPNPVDTSQEQAASQTQRIIYFPDSFGDEPVTTMTYASRKETASEDASTIDENPMFDDDDAEDLFALFREPSNTYWI